MKQIVLIVLGALLLFSCEHSEDLECSLQTKSCENKNQDRIGLSPDIEELSVNDAKIVATIFKNNGNKSRSESDLKIIDVVTIPSDDGTPALYAVNLEKGYLIIPATKKLPPILAKVDDGKFTTGNVPFGRDILISQMKDRFEYCKNHNIEEDNDIAWHQFLKKESSDRVMYSSRVASDNDPWYVQSEKMYELEQQGYLCYRITKFEDEQEIMPEDILQQFKNSARFEDGDNIWEEEWGEGFIYNTAFIAIKDYNTTSSSTNVGPLLTTKWDQWPFYNYMIDRTGNSKPLGCVTIAVGQLMKYYRYPNYFSWLDMPDVLNGGYECPLTTFLAKLHDDLGVNDNGGTTDGKAKSVLEKYGYKVEKKSHVNGSYNIPSYCSGFSSSTDLHGHAWVCDGCSSTKFATDYELYILDTAHSSKFEYTMLDKVEKRKIYTYYHMNWGWGGRHDGGYNEGGLFVNGTNYNYRRTDMIITKP